MSVVNVAAHIERLRGLYRAPEPEQQRRELIRQADSLSACLVEAAQAPTPERLEHCAIRLDAVRRLALSFRAALVEEAKGAADADL